MKLGKWGTPRWHSCAVLALPCWGGCEVLPEGIPQVLQSSGSPYGEVPLSPAGLSASPALAELIISQIALGECWSFSIRTVELCVPNLNALLLGCLSSGTFPALPQGKPRVLPGHLSWAGHACPSKGCDGTSIFWLLRGFVWSCFAPVFGFSKTGECLWDLVPFASS